MSTIRQTSFINHSEKGTLLRDFHSLTNSTMRILQNTESKTIDPTESEETQLLTSSRDGDMATLLRLRHLVKNNITNIAGNTPLHLAVIKGQIRAIEFLVENGADLNAVNNYGWTPFMEACHRVPPHERDNISATQLLVNFEAILNIFLKCGFNINITHTVKKSYLSQLAFSGSLEAIKILHKKGANLNIVDQFGETPLHYVATRGHYEKEQLKVAHYLLNNGASLHIRNIKGHTPLDCAKSSTGNKSVYCLFSKLEMSAAFSAEKQFTQPKLSTIGHFKIKSKSGPSLLPSQNKALGTLRKFMKCKL